MPTLTQLAPLLRLFAPAVVGILTQYIGADAATQIVSVLLSLAGAGAWSLYANKQSSLTQTVAGFKDDRGKPAVKVLVSSTAPEGLLKLASDTSVPEVVHAASVSPTAPPPKDPYATSRRAS